MATTTNYSWTTPDDTALVKDGASAIRSLGTAIDTTTYNNSLLPIVKTIVDAKGDIIAATAADTVARLAVGTNGQVLTADSTAATGLAYTTPAASGGMTLLNSGGTTLTGASVTISSISQDYKNLYVLLKNVVLSANNILGLRLNGDTGNNYAFVGISPSSSGSSTIIAGNPDDKYTLARDVGTLTTALNKGQIEFTITRYTDTDQVAIFSNAYSVHTNTDFQSTFFTGVYDCSAAITSLTVKPNSGTFSGGTIYVYGVN